MHGENRSASVYQHLWLGMSVWEGGMNDGEAPSKICQPKRGEQSLTYFTVQLIN